MTRGSKIAAILVLATIMGCAGSRPAVPAGDGARDTPAPETERRTPVTLVVGQGLEMAAIGRLGRNDSEANHMAYAGLVTRDSEAYRLLPWLAEDLPSVSKGTWRVNPDGTMATTWRMRPGVKWHDGTPFHAKEFAFGWQVMSDLKMEFESRGLVELMDRIDAPDDRTVVIHWKQSYPLADAVFSTLLFPLPSHILGDTYAAADYEALNHHTYWNSTAVHLGPFKVAEFVRGSHVEFLAFDDYFLGRPRVDRVIWRVIPDSKALLTAVLSNDVDVTMRGALTIETALIAEQQWVARGEGVVRFSPTNWERISPGPTNPIFGWDAPHQSLVRQALMHSINRQEIVETLSHGRENVAHFPLAPVAPQFARADAAARKYAFDVRRAEQLLAEAGWTMGPDGVRVNERGDRLSVELRSSNRADQEQLQAVLAGYFKQVGIEIRLLTLTNSQSNSADYRNRWPGLAINPQNYQVEDWRDRYHTKNTPTAANSWLLLNVSGWKNPAKDQLIDDIEATLDRDRRDGMIVEWLRLFTVELPQLPLKYGSEVTSYRSTVKNVPVRVESGGENYRTWNVHLWEKTG